MGVVYRARDQKTGREVALKVLHSHLRRDASYRERFRREATIAQALDSRHLVRVLDFCDDEDTAFIVMEYVPGDTLAQRLRRGPLPIAQALEVGIQVARALEEAHDKSVLHRDIKPQNVILDSDGDAKVADFGIARSEEQKETLTGSFLGAVYYTAPERFHQEADERSDIYSLGVVLYEMLAGRPPFSGPITFQTVKRIIEEEPPHLLSLRPDVSATLAALVHACMAKDRKARPQSAFEVRRALEALYEEYLQVQGETVPARLFSPPALAKGRPLALRFGLAAVILGPVLGLLVAFALFSSGESPPSNEAITLRPVTLRQGPGLDYPQVGEVPQGAIVSLLARSQDGGWVYVRLANYEEGWLPVAAISTNVDLGALAIATAAPPTPRPQAAGCEVQGSEPIAAVLARCQAEIEFNPDCLRGQVCGVRNDNGATVLLANDRTLVYVDETGNLVVDRAAGTHPQRLTSHGLARQPSWSPDGRYIAYVLTEPLDVSVPVLERRYAYQLRLIEVDRPANEGVLVASTESEQVPEWQQRRIVWPQWSPNGDVIYFAWAGRDNRAAALYSVPVPRFGSGVDIRALRIDAPRHETFLPSGLRLVSIQPSSFGASTFFGGFAVMADGTLLVQHCRAEPVMTCSLGRWDGESTYDLRTAAEGEVFALAGLGGDGVTAYGYMFTADGEDWVVRISLLGEHHNLLRFDATRAGSPLFTRRLGISPDGRRMLIETGEPRYLALLDLESQQEATWKTGHSPAWYSIPPAMSRPLGIATLPTAPFATPAPTPQPPPPQGGPFDLEATVVRGTCVRGQELVLRLTNVGAGAMVQQPVFIRVTTLTGFNRNVVGPITTTLQPGESRDFATGYVVEEAVNATVDPFEVLRELNRANNTARCQP